MKGPILQARAVSKVLGKGAKQVRALDDVDLTLRGGELTILMGPSGSGKTTLLSVLGCMLTPTSGEVRVCGNTTAGASPHALAGLRRDHVGFVFQNYHLFPTLTAAENVQLALDLRGIRGRRARVQARDTLARVGLADKGRSFPSELSGGEQQRVAIARSIVSEPSAVLADEPTAAVDGSNGQAIMRILKEIAGDKRRSVLVVTHDLRLLSFADRAVSIEDGRLVKDERAHAQPQRLATSGR